MQFKMVFLLAGLSIGATLPQTPDDELRSRIVRVRYATLAEYAQVQGDVQLKVNSGKVTVLFGHALLTPTAVDSANALRPILGGDDLNVTYHFVLTNSTNVPTSVLVKRGNRLGRAFMRLFGLNPEKTVVRYQCEEVPPPPNDLSLSGVTLEVWINGRSHCLTTEAD